MATTHEHLSDNIKDRIIGLERVDPASLTAHPQNFRRHPTAQRRALRASIERFGWSAAVLVTRDGTVVDGHARVEEALSAGLATVPVLRLDMTEKEAGALILRLDPIAALAEHDTDILSELLAEEEWTEDEEHLADTLGVVLSKSLNQGDGTISDVDVGASPDACPMCGREG